MPPPALDAVAINRLLATLPPAELERILPHLTIHQMAKGDTIQEPWTPVTSLIFPTGALLSVVNETQEGQSVEVATIGREGLFGSSAYLGGSVTPLRTMVQIAGPAAVGNVSALVSENGETPLRLVSLRYAQTMMVHASVTAACNRLHPLEMRAARWLLNTADRMDSLTFTLTHEFFAVMLGAQRPSVSLAAKALQRRGFIEYRRGHLEIIDRDGLAATACECYATVVRHYEQTMGIPLRTD